jgi:predicted permease
MRFWHLVIARLRSLALRRRREAELDEELRLHLEREVERHIARGLAPDEARQRARRDFGGVAQIKEECRDARGTTMIDAFSRDTSHAIRRLVRDWRFTSAAVVILGLGIGANTAIFSVINATLFRESSFVDPDRLVEIYQNEPEGRPGLTSYPAFQDIAEYTQLFASVTATSVPDVVSYQDQGALRRAVAEHTTPTYLSVLGLAPSLGRWFDGTEDTPGADVVAVLGYRAWTTRFGADPSAVGRTIRIEGVPVTIIGVGPPQHDSTMNIGLVTDFWLPVASWPALGGPPRVLERRPFEPPFLVKARLRDGVTVAQAQEAMNILGTRLATDYPDLDPGAGITVLASADVRVHPQMDPPIAALASIVLIVVGLVLAIACSNLATLLLVRGTARAKEVSVRLALGATRRQLVRHLLTESVLLSLAGGAAGCVMARWGIGSLALIDLPVTFDFSLDYRVLSFAVVLALLTGVAFGLAPALKATRLDLVTTLRDEGGLQSPDRRWFTLKNSLVVFQVAVSVVLLSGTGVFLQLVFAARALHVGYAVDGVAMLETDARYAGYSAAEAERVYEELRRRIAAIPGVQSAVLSTGRPMQTVGLPVVLEGAGAADGTIILAHSTWAGPGFFETLDIPILFGRALDERDRAATRRVAVINESMARQHFGDVNAVGRRFRIDQDAEWIEIVGVARDTRTANLAEEIVDPTPHLFFRSPVQWGRPSTTLLARTSLGAAALVGAMQRELQALDAGLPVLTATTMAQHLERSLVFPQAVATFFGVLGALGLMLAAIGLYSVVAFAVSRRSREIGIRMALGSRGQQVVGRVAREAAVLVGAGTGAGLMLSLLAILGLRQISLSAPGNVFTPAPDPVAMTAIALFMAIVGAAAAYVPARRAARMDPLVALRHD